MKVKLLTRALSLIFAAILGLTACGGNSPITDSTSGGNAENTTGTTSGSESTTDIPETATDGGTRIRFDFDGQTVYGTLDDNSVSRDLISRLPLTLDFSDYNSIEKIAYLPDGSDEWDLSDAPDSCTPATGDIAMYSPWGNISIFYDSFRESSGLVPLGRLDEGGASVFAAMSGNFSVTISLANQTAPTEHEGSKTLVAYFSATGNTKAVAERISELCGGDLYEIVPAEPYTADDLNYNNNNCRANKEMNDDSARPAIGSETLDISEYDTIIIGYPIWWGTMPRIINTFLDTYDLSGKTILPFCTSGGSGISKSVSDKKAAEPDATVDDGLRVSGANDKNLENWLRDAGL